MAMRNRQTGVSLMGLLIGMFVLLFLVLLGFKLIPPYMEFSRAKSAIETIGRGKPASVNDVRKQFDARATVDDIATLKGSDLEITKDGNDVVISFAYRKEVPLFANLGMYVDFAADSRGQ
jgi:hypothetical protein